MLSSLGISTSSTSDRPADLKANWSRFSAGEPLPRSSHSLSIVDGRAYIFGGEVKPREPVDNSIHVLILPSSSIRDADHQVIPARSDTDDNEVPPPRLGHTAAVAGRKIYIFGGRDGVDMKPLEEKGRVWVFDTRKSRWSHLDPMPDTPFPEPRSYHASTSTEHPLPDPRDGTVRPIVPDEEVNPPETTEGHGTVFVHGGCTASGGRVSEVWAFDVAARTWTRFPDAPGPGRGGPCFAFAQDRIWVYGGFDGDKELGGQVDYLDLTVAKFDDQGGVGELCVSPQSGVWNSIETTEGMPSPGPRSVAGFQQVTTGQGRSYLVLLFGEGAPSSSGHEGAGGFFSDIWAFRLRPEGMTTASLTEATKMIVGKDMAEYRWSKVELVATEDVDGRTHKPIECGWFASATSDIDPAAVTIWGGVDSENNRIGHGWTLNLAC